MLRCWCQAQVHGNRCSRGAKPSSSCMVAARPQTCTAAEQQNGGSRRSAQRPPSWAEWAPLLCRNLMRYCEARGWDQGGVGDWNVRVEQYLLLADGKYHAVDVFNRRQPVTATPIYVRTPAPWVPPPHPACCHALLAPASMRVARQLLRQGRMVQPHPRCSAARLLCRAGSLPSSCQTLGRLGQSSSWGSPRSRAQTRTTSPSTPSFWQVCALPALWPSLSHPIGSGLVRSWPARARCAPLASTVCLRQCVARTDGRWLLQSLGG